MARDSRVFADREDAGRRLARRLMDDTVFGVPDDVVVLALPRGGVPVAHQVARALAVPLDVMVVWKFGVPFAPEIAMGAAAEHGSSFVDRGVVRGAVVSDAQVVAAQERACGEVARRVERYRADRPPPALEGRTVLLVDDGVATGKTALAACRAAASQGAHRTLLAVPVAPPEAVRELRMEADDVIALELPGDFENVGQWYEEFPQVEDEEVVRRLLDATISAPPYARTAGRSGAVIRPTLRQEITVTLPNVRLPAELLVPLGAQGLVIVSHAHGHDGGRRDPHNRDIVERLSAVGRIATLVVDLLTPQEAFWEENTVDLDLLVRRLHAVTDAVRDDFTWLGYLGAGAAAGAALRIAAEADSAITSVVTIDGRLEQSGSWLSDVAAPVLLIVGAGDSDALRRHSQAYDRLPTAELLVVPDVTQVLAVSSSLEQVADRAREWFLRAAPQARRVRA
jgi:putative phosphoribosyl transferase